MSICLSIYRYRLLIKNYLLLELETAFSAASCIIVSVKLLCTMCSFLQMDLSSELSCHVVIEIYSKILSQSNVFSLDFWFWIESWHCNIQDSFGNASGFFYHKRTALPLLSFPGPILISTAVNDDRKWHHKPQCDITKERVFQLSC